LGDDFRLHFMLDDKLRAESGSWHRGHMYELQRINHRPRAIKPLSISSETKL